jgi:hypothetical protein
VMSCTRSRSSRSSRTKMGRPSSSTSFSVLMAAAASSAVSNSTMPQPRDRPPLPPSRMTSAYTTAVATNANGAARNQRRRWFDPRCVCVRAEPWTTAETRVRTVTARPEVVLQPLQVTAAHRSPCQKCLRVSRGAVPYVAARHTRG